MYAERDTDIDREESPEVSSIGDTVEAFLSHQTRGD